MTNPGNNPFPPEYASEADINNLQTQIDSNDTSLSALGGSVTANSEHLTLLGSWALQFTGTGISTGFYIMTQVYGDISGPSSQSTVMRMQPCVIKKVYISTNGGGEWTGGTLEWEFWKNAVRTGTPDYTSGPKLNNGVNFDYLTDNQRATWDTTNVTMAEDDYITARVTATSVTGGPEGIYMQLWGSRT